MTRAEWKLFWKKVDWSSPTSHIAKRLKLKVSTVSCARRRLSPKSINKTRIKRRQTLLDSVPLLEWRMYTDKELARKYGCAPSGIAWHRESRRLPVSPGKPLSELRHLPFQVWRQKTNRQIADETGKSKGSVASYRLKHRLPRSPKAVLKFSSLHNVPVSDWQNKTCVEIGKETGHSRQSVQAFKHHHGKPRSPYLSRLLKSHLLNSKPDSFFVTNTDHQISRMTGISRSVVSRARKAYGKPAGPRITGRRRYFNPFPDLRQGELISHLTKQ